MASPVSDPVTLAAVRPQRTFLGHPIGLYFLFFTEMWERFSYYGMRALLMLYMVNYFRMSQKEASFYYKWYTSLVYLTPLLGGYIADRYLGNKRAVVIGAVSMAIGHFLMAFEPLPAFFSALVFLIIGNGFFKPNMSTQVGRLYPPNDPRRDGAYTIFYMGINLGALLSPLGCGWLAENTLGGYHSGFTVAGIGMVCGLVIYLVGLPWIKELNPSQEPSAAAGKAESLPRDFIAALRDLQKQTEKAKSDVFVAMVHMPELPRGFNVKKGGLLKDEVRYDATTQTLIATKRLTDSEIQALMMTINDPRFAEMAESENGGPPAIGRQFALPEKVAEQTPSATRALNQVGPFLMAVAGGMLAVVALLLGFLKGFSWDGFLNTTVPLLLIAIPTLIGSWILSRVHNAMRDRVMAIFGLGVFVVFFWAAFEQAGNALNLWADKTTDRYLTTVAPPPPIFPMVIESEESIDRPASSWDRWSTMFRLKPGAGVGSNFLDPVPTAWFQSINAVAIVIIAPFFAIMWTWLGRRGWNPSIPTKMAVGLVLMGLGFVIMIYAGERENQPSEIAYRGPLPEQIKLTGQQQLATEEEGKGLEAYHAGRLRYDAAEGKLKMTGVLPDTERDRIVRDTAPTNFKKAVEALKEMSIANQGEGTASVTIERVPDGFDLRYAGFSKRKIDFNPSTRQLTATNIELADKDVKALLVAGGDKNLRNALDQLYVNSSAFRVSSWWLFWFYILATLGELCLSPVGLSMVSKLAPAKFATMLMGMWLLTSFFGGFAAGSFGEIWGTVAPIEFFWIFVAALGVAALVLFVLVRKIVAMMHGVN